MLSLHLNLPGDGIAPPPPPPLEHNRLPPHEDPSQRLQQWLHRIEILLWRALGAESGGGGGRSEARLWLCSSLAALAFPSHLHPPIFLPLIAGQKSKPRRPHRPREDPSHTRPVALQVLRILCDQRPRDVAQLFAGDSRLIRSFFAGHPKRILRFFENFAGLGQTEHRFGAQALSRFAFGHRDSCWHELEWKGTHGQAPATVASKPYYFLELDVLRTVENFLDNVPVFWSSQELWDSLKDGQFLSLDMDFFIEELYQKMFHDDSSEVWMMVKTFLSHGTFSDLCNRILPLLTDQELLTFINCLGSTLSKLRKTTASERKQDLSRLCSPLVDAGSNNSWLEEVLFSGEECFSLDCAILCNACVGHARQLLRTCNEDGNEQEISSLKQLVSELKDSQLFQDTDHWSLMKEGLTLNKWMAIKWMSIELWAIYVLIKEDYQSDASLEALLLANKIEFQHSGKDSSHKIELLDDREDRWMESRSSKVRRKKKERKRKRRKKRRKSFSSDQGGTSSSEGEDGLTINVSSRGRDQESWYLSTDNFMLAWHKADLPEHLVGYAFGEWLKWAISQW